MQAQEGAAALVMDEQVVDIEALPIEAASGDALLPVPLPNVSSEAMIDDAEAAKPDEVRGLLAAIHRLGSIVEEETAALATDRKSVV